MTDPAWSSPIELIDRKTSAAGLGFLTHYILNHGEWDSAGHLLVSFWMVAFSLITILEYVANPRTGSIVDAFRASGSFAGVYLTTFLSSLMIYRGFFHRLRKFPGPFPARLSKLYSIALVAPRFQLYNDIEQLHKRYKSDFVRTGPRELSVAAVDAVALVHGPTSRCRKGPWYSGVNANKIEGASLIVLRDKEAHRLRRKLWDRALSAKSVRDYEPRINRHTYALVERLKEHAPAPFVRISDWINFYAFDVMGDIGFSRDFGMVRSGEEDEQIKRQHKSQDFLRIFTHMIWSLSFLMRLPGVVNGVQKSMAWNAKILEERSKITHPENDVLGWLLDPDAESISLDTFADSRLMVVAGSDTISTTLTWLVYELCKNKQVQARLRETVDAIAPEKAFLDAADLANCPYLDGVIHEALRLHPAAPSGVQRETPPEGITLPDQTYIPGETLVVMPIHTMQRDPRYFRSPLTFLPERWTDEKPGYVIDKRAYMPFSAGSYSCVGQKLAMVEMRSVVANLVRTFAVEFAEGETGESIEKETRDCFTLIVGKVDVKLTPRRGDV